MDNLILLYEAFYVGGTSPYKAMLLWFQFKAISQAYEVLSDQKKRDLYDRGGEQAIKEGGIASEMHNPMDIFDMFFGSGRGRQSGPPRGKDVVHQMKVSLEDVCNGAVRKLALQKNIICPKCEGWWNV